MFAKNYRSCRAALCSKERQDWLVGKLYFLFQLRVSQCICVYELLCNVAVVCSCCCCALLLRKVMVMNIDIVKITRRRITRATPTQWITVLYEFNSYSELVGYARKVLMFEIKLLFLVDIEIIKTPWARKPLI